MKPRVKKQVYIGIILSMMAVLLFSSCSSSHQTTSGSSGKHTASYTEDKFKTLYYDGLIQKIQGNYDDALGYFKQCLRINPSSADADFEVSQIFKYNKQPDSSLVYIKRAVAYDPDNIWYGYFYAQNLQQLGHYKEEVKVYDELVKRNPKNTDLYYKLALAQLQDNEYKEALVTYSKMEEKTGPLDEDLVMDRIEIMEKTKDYAKAEEEIKKLIKRDSTTAQYYDMLGNLYDLEGKHDRAFEVYQKMENDYPHDPMVHLSLADYYKTGNQDKKAFDELQKAFREPSLDIDTKIRIILALNTFTSSDSIFDEALTLSREMVAADPTEPRAHAIYGELLQHNNNLPEAREQYRSAVGEDSSKYTYWKSLIDIDVVLNDVKALQVETQKSLNLFPDNAQLYYYNGIANMQMKDYSDALHSFKSGVFYVTNDSSLMELFYQSLGDVNYYLKRYAASDSSYNEALVINPNNDYVLNNYSYFLSIRDTNLDLAAKMSKKSNGLVQNNNSYEDTYGWILYMSGKYQDAKEWEYKAITDGGEKDATILEHYGDVLFKLGDKDSAVDYWSKAKNAGAGSELLDREIKDKQLYTK